MSGRTLAFEPDILVIGPDATHPGLVVETKLSLSDLEMAETQLKRYMSGMRCPMGMLLTPVAFRLYRDTYRECGEGSVDLVGEFAIPGNIARAAGRTDPTATTADRAIEFAEAAQAWLERLARGSGLEELPEQARKAIESDVLPTLTNGEIWAARPRSPRASA